jgi:hypothetical protein
MGCSVMMWYKVLWRGGWLPRKKAPPLGRDTSHRGGYHGAFVAIFVTHHTSYRTELGSALTLQSLDGFASLKSSFYL